MFDLGDACENQQNLTVAEYALERAVEYDKDNIEYNRRLGHLLVERRDYKPHGPALNASINSIQTMAMLAA